MKSLAQIFNNAVFRVPDYQRGYAWESRQLEDFWRDLNWLRPNQQHYTGMLTLRPIEANVSAFPTGMPHTVYELVDGQQRLTTAYILLHKLITHAGNGAIGGQPTVIARYAYLSAEINNLRIPVFGYDSAEQMAFFNTLLAADGTKLKASNVYQRNLLNAAEFLGSKLRQVQDDAQLGRIFNKLTTQLVFDIHEVQSTFDVCAMFESINYRGKKLTKFEVLKNRLIYLSELIGRGDERELAASARLRERIEAAWGGAFRALGTGTELLDEDEFLLNHTIMHSGPLVKEKDALDTRLFKDLFSSDRLAEESENPIGLSEIEVYVVNIEHSARLWATLHCRASEVISAPWLTGEVQAWLLRLNRLKMRHFRPLILGALNRISAAATSETAADLVNLLAGIERFIFIVYALCGYHSSESSKTYFSDFGWGLFTGEKNYSFAGTAVELDRYVFSHDDDGDFSGIFDPTQAINRAHARFIKDDGWNDWSEIKYFLSEWEAYAESMHLTDAVMRESEYAHMSIEHIMPRKPDGQGQWTDAEKSLGRRFKYVLHDLGNLTLLGIGANKAVQDIDLRSKSQAYAVTRSGADILRRAGRQVKWDEEHIQERGLAMLKFAIKRWSIPGQQRDGDYELDLRAMLSTDVKPPRKPRGS